MKRVVIQNVMSVNNVNRQSQNMPQKEPFVGSASRVVVTGAPWNRRTHSLLVSVTLCCQMQMPKGCHCWEGLAPRSGVNHEEEAEEHQLSLIYTWLACIHEALAICRGLPVKFAVERCWRNCSEERCEWERSRVCSQGTSDCGWRHLFLLQLTLFHFCCTERYTSACQSRDDIFWANEVQATSV